MSANRERANLLAASGAKLDQDWSHAVDWLEKCIETGGKETLDQMMMLLEPKYPASVLTQCLSEQGLQLIKAMASLAFHEAFDRLGRKHMLEDEAEGS